MLRSLWLQIGLCLVLLVALDAATRLYFYLTTPTYVDSRVFADGYNHAAWVPEYFDDLGGAQWDWNPYTYWLLVPFKSRYFNVDDSGLRATLPAKLRPQRKLIRIFVFGGSTALGEGSRDDYTIPSWLQRMLNETANPAQVTNFGQDGYVNTQEMILLFEQLEKGNVPDVVIFYDGFNDYTAAMIDGTAGVTFGEQHRRIEFNAFNIWSSDHSLLYKQAFMAFAMDSGMGRLARNTLKLLWPRRFKEIKGRLTQIATSEERAAAVEHRARLQEQVVSIYLANKRLIEAAGHSFGFKSLFFWQPNVYTKTRLTAYEAEQKWLPGEKEFMTGVYGRIAEIASRESIRDLSGVFGNSQQAYYIDDVHITENGNRIVAEAMLPQVLRVLDERAAHCPQAVTYGQGGAVR